MADLVVLAAVVALSASQLFQKLAVDRAGVKRGEVRWRAVVLRPELALALVLLAAGTVLWLYGLYRMDVSRAFPFLSLGTVAVTLIARFVLKEHVAAVRWAGVALVTLGVLLVAST